MEKNKSFISELFRRRVIRVLLGYIAVAWLLFEGLSTLFQVFELPGYWLQVYLIVALVMIPVVGWLAWRYDFTPPQLVLDPKDVEHANPELSRAMNRHDSREAGYILLKWKDGDGKPQEKRFFKAISVGRDEKNDIQIHDERVSRHHAVFWAMLVWLREARVLASRSKRETRSASLAKDSGNTLIATSLSSVVSVAL